MWNVSKKTNFLLITLVALTCGLSMASRAGSPLQMVMMVSGGEGSTGEAAPYLDGLAAELTKNSGLIFNIRYYPEKSVGMAALGSAQLAIVSLDLLAEITKKQKIEILLATIPTQSNKAEEKYYLMSSKNADEQAKGDSIYFSKNYSPDFIRNFILKEAWMQKHAIQTAGQVLPTLKKMAQNHVGGYVLLDSFEYASLKKLTFDWAQNLQTVYESPALPSAPLIALTANMPDKEKIRQAFLDLKNPEILGILRLRGFKAANPDDYKNFL